MTFEIRNISSHSVGNPKNWNLDFFEPLQKPQTWSRLTEPRPKSIRIQLWIIPEPDLRVIYLNWSTNLCQPSKTHKLWTLEVYSPCLNQRKYSFFCSQNFPMWLADKKWHYFWLWGLLLYNCNFKLHLISILARTSCLNSHNIIPISASRRRCSLFP